jgi:hypothetical protein
MDDKKAAQEFFNADLVIAPVNSQEVGHMKKS